MTKKIFTKEFTLQESLPPESIKAALEVLKTGRLHRYNTAKDEISPAALFEAEFADYIGSKYCLGLSSCGSALYVALKSVGVKPGDQILCNTFTLAPVPGAIQNAGAIPIFIEIEEDYLIDLADLDKKARESKAKYLMLSHMRGHIVNMDKIMDICRKYHLILIEDCAHTLGAKWNGKNSGTFGKVGCYSTQTYKHMNSGEGGILITNDEDVMAQAIIYSGSYMLYDTHRARPESSTFEPYREYTPNYSLRMSNLVAALLRPQLKNLDRQIIRWNERYRIIETILKTAPHIFVPNRDMREEYVASSFQFTLQDIQMNQVDMFLAQCAERGVEIKWFGAKKPHGFTSKWNSWKYFEELPELKKSEEILDFLCDFRIPLTFELEDCQLVAEIIKEVAEEVF